MEYCNANNSCRFQLVLHCIFLTSRRKKNVSTNFDCTLIAFAKMHSNLLRLKVNQQKNIGKGSFEYNNTDSPLKSVYIHLRIGNFLINYAILLNIITPGLFDQR